MVFSLCRQLSEELGPSTASQCDLKYWAKRSNVLGWAMTYRLMPHSGEHTHTHTHRHTHTIMPGLIQGALEGRLRQLFVSGALTPGPLLTCSPTSPHLLPWLVPYCLFLSAHLQGLH
jgi:hypothetical protein